MHFLQIWALPNKSGLTAKYYARKFSDEEKRNKVVKVVGTANTEGVHNKRNTSGPAPVSLVLLSNIQRKLYLTLNDRCTRR